MTDTIRLHVTADQDRLAAYRNALQAIDYIEHVAQVADLMPDVRDDSSSAQTHSPQGPGAHDLDVFVPDDKRAEFEKIAMDLSRAHEVVVEFVEAV